MRRGFIKVYCIWEGGGERIVIQHTFSEVMRWSNGLRRLSSCEATNAVPGSNQKKDLIQKNVHFILL